MSVILITGSDGLIGTALRKVSNEYPDDFIFCSRKDADLTCEEDVAAMYKKYKPDYVVHAAARVGGIGLNLSKPAELFYQNILMNSFMIHYAYLYKVKKIVCYSSVCSFPDNLPLLKEGEQQTGEPYKDNFAYGYAKRMIDIQIQAYRKQYGVNYCSIIATNLYGPNDNFNLEDGHVIPALIHKCYLAKKNNESLAIWGNGLSLREFIYSEDAARLTYEILKTPMVNQVILSNTREMTIKQVCQIICDKMQFAGEIVFDETKPNGQYRRPSDTSLLHSIVPNSSFTDHETALGETVKWFSENYYVARM